jgi:hypothetical protein
MILEKGSLIIIIVLKAGRLLNMSGAPSLGGAFVEPNRRKSKRARPHPASNRRGAFWIPPACRNEWIRKGAGFYFRAGQEVKARRRREVRLPGKEEDKKVLSSISTCFPRRWK